MLIIALFVISFFAVAVSQASEGPTTIKGTIVSISDNTGKVKLMDESGKAVTLMAPANIDLKGLSAGDQVIVESSADGFIKSISKHK